MRRQLSIADATLLVCCPLGLWFWPKERALVERSPIEQPASTLSGLTHRCAPGTPDNPSKHREHQQKRPPEQTVAQPELAGLPAPLQSVEPQVGRTEQRAQRLLEGPSGLILWLTGKPDGAHE